MNTLSSDRRSGWMITTNLTISTYPFIFYGAAWSPQQLPPAPGQRARPRSALRARQHGHQWYDLHAFHNLLLDLDVFKFAHWNAGFSRSSALESFQTDPKHYVLPTIGISSTYTKKRVSNGNEDIPKVPLFQLFSNTTSSSLLSHVAADSSIIPMLWHSLVRSLIHMCGFALLKNLSNLGVSDTRTCVWAETASLASVTGECIQ